jgi:hypothetical protein
MSAVPAFPGLNDIIYWTDAQIRSLRLLDRIGLDDGTRVSACLDKSCRMSQSLCIGYSMQSTFIPDAGKWFTIVSKMRHY